MNTVTEYAVLEYVEGQEHPRLAGINNVYRDEALARDYLAWLEGEHRDELREEARLEKIKGQSNILQHQWAEEQLTTYVLVSREVTAWREMD